MYPRVVDSQNYQDEDNIKNGPFTHRFLQRGHRWPGKGGGVNYFSAKWGMGGYMKGVCA